MITIKDIARETGYSVSTVSRVLSGHPDVSDTAKLKISELIEKYQFVPNSNAQQLKQQTTKAIVIIVKGKTNMLFAAIIENIQVLIEKSGYAAIVNYLDEDENEVLEAYRICRKNKPLGLIFLGGNIDYFKSCFDKITIPSVLVTNSAKELDFQNLSSVSSDDVNGASCAIDYLIKHGHTKIGIIGGRTDSSFPSSLRYQGCLQSFKKYGINYNETKQYIVSRYSFSDAHCSMIKLLSQTPDITAVFCMSDVMAIGAIRALRDMNISVPGNMSVIGYDGIELAEYYNPKITTIKQNHKKLAKRGVKILIDNIECKAGVMHEFVKTDLLPGESVISNIK